MPASRARSLSNIGAPLRASASSSCPRARSIQPGDLLGSGTLSGPSPDQAGSLLELTQGGKQPLTLRNGEKRTFLEDGDTLILRGYCEAEAAVRIGLGEASAAILPA
jgi:fumarylacetoacetase